MIIIIIILSRSDHAQLALRGLKCLILDYFERDPQIQHNYIHNIPAVAFQGSSR